MLRRIRWQVERTANCRPSGWPHRIQSARPQRRGRALRVVWRWWSVCGPFCGRMPSGSASTLRSCTSYSNAVCEPYDWLMHGQGKAPVNSCKRRSADYTLWRPTSPFMFQPYCISSGFTPPAFGHVGQTEARHNLKVARCRAMPSDSESDINDQNVSRLQVSLWGT